MVFPRRPGTCCGVLVATVVMVMIIHPVLNPSSGAIVVEASSASSGLNSIKAELFHRDHPFSAGMLPSEGLAIEISEKLHIAGRRSIARSRAFVQRRLTTDVSPSTSGDGLSPSPSMSPAMSPALSPAGAGDTTSTWETSISDEAPAEYLMRISLGTPGQDFVLVVDTGSDLTWMRCAPYENSYNDLPSPVFDPSLSCTFQNLTCASDACQSFLSQYGTPFVTACSPSCAYAYFYGDGSNTTGMFSTDTVNLKSTRGHDVQVQDFWFGCSHSAYSGSVLLDSADGVVGFGQGLISFPSQLGAVFENRFSYCLVNRSLAAVQSSPLMFGQDPTLDRNVTLQYTPIIKNEYYPFFYYIGVEDILVNGEAVDYPRDSLQLDSEGNGGTIIDSGTTLTTLDSRAFTALLAAVDSKVPNSFRQVMLTGDPDFPELCYDVTGDPDYGTKLPSISFKLCSGACWDLSLDNSWALLPDTPSEGTMLVCISMMRGDEGTMSILGNTQQQDFLVVYDQVDQRLGFAPTDCGQPTP